VEPRLLSHGLTRLFLNHIAVCGVIWGHAPCGPATPSHQFLASSPGSLWEGPGHEASQFCGNIHDSIYTVPCGGSCLHVWATVSKLWGGALAPESQTLGGGFTSIALHSCAYDRCYRLARQDLSRSSQLIGVAPRG